MNRFQINLEKHLRVMSSLNGIEKSINHAVEIILGTINRGGKILFIGNGGSAADCQHLAAEFVGRFVANRRPLPALALTVDTSAITCIANDFSYNEVFSRQVLGVGTSLDTLFAISTSGNSVSIIHAVEEAKRIPMQTISLIGRDGGKLKGMSDCDILVQSDETARIQEAHIFIGHHICSEIDRVVLSQA